MHLPFLLADQVIDFPVNAKALIIPDIILLIVSLTKLKKRNKYFCFSAIVPGIILTDLALAF
jgi:hypothetical protein